MSRSCRVPGRQVRRPGLTRLVTIFSPSNWVSVKPSKASRRVKRSSASGLMAMASPSATDANASVRQ
jgi:hypothetical protein